MHTISLRRVVAMAILLWLLIGVEINDVMAYLCGRLFGHRKLCPNTSPNKTVGGAVGAPLPSTRADEENADQCQ